MMIGDPNRPNPTVQIPHWDPFDNPTAHISSSFFHSNAGGGGSGDYSPSVEALTAALHRFLPSNESDSLSEDLDVPVDAFSCDQFRMYEFKVRKCARGRSHDWTECPYAHPGEKARRRDPRRYHYSGTACPEFRKGSCKKGDSCEFAHGVFECWLHPARYRTQPCKDGQGCLRRICFFAHTPEQLRLSESEYGFPSRHAFDSYLPNGMFVDSPTSILASSMMSPISPSSESPPMSPNGFQLGGGSFNSVNELAAVMGNLRLGKMKMSPRSRGVQLGSGLGSPRILSHGFNSLPSTPTRGPTRSGLGSLDLWQQTCEEEEHVIERVESGRNLREKMFAKLSEEKFLGQFDSVATSCPDVGWISELVK